MVSNILCSRYCCCITLTMGLDSVEMNTYSEWRYTTLYEWLKKKLRRQK